LLRSSADAPERGKVTIVGRNPDAIWFSGYDDRVIYDEAGLYANVDQAASMQPAVARAM
jgi:lysine 2,3-aminomutase